MDNVNCFGLFTLSFFITRIGPVVLPKQVECGVISEQVLEIDLIVTLLNTALLFFFFFFPCMTSYLKAKLLGCRM